MLTPSISYNRFRKGNRNKMSRNVECHSNRSKLSKMFSKIGLAKKGNMDLVQAVIDGEDLVIGNPTDIQHNINVKVNENGELENMPESWRIILEQSKISLVNLNN